MPSLQVLEEFKASFNELGDEQQTLMEMDLPPDDLPLPSNEPAVEPTIGVEQPAGTGQTDLIDFGDLGELLGDVDNEILGEPASDQTKETSQEDIDFGTFIDAIPDNFTPEEPQDEVPEDLGSSSGLPPGLLDGFADEIEAERAQAKEHGETEEDIEDLTEPLAEDSEETNNTDSATDQSDETGNDDFSESFGDLELGSPDFFDQDLEQDLENREMVNKGLGNIDLDTLPSVSPDESLELLSEDPAVSVEKSEDETAEGNFAESPGEMVAEDLGSEIEDLSDQSLEDLPAFDSDEFPDLPAEESIDEAGAESLGEELTDEDTEFQSGDEESPFDFSMPDEIPGEEEVAAELPEDEDNFDLGGEPSNFDSSAVLEEIPGDSFDNFKLDANSLAGNFDLETGDTADFGDSFGSSDDFSLSGIDSVFDGKSPGAAERLQAFGEEENEVEEIRLTNEEFEQFQATLASYPLNLRIVCEELIAEQAVAPDLMSRLVKLLVNGASARETAALAGQILGRSIPVPKGSEKKTGEALEAEQASFAYIFIHNFLPVFRLFLAVAMVLLSMGYLGWKFIYTPLKAENIYKLGYERIAAGEYGRANERFLEAFKINEKKVWFYRYARAFREARQYTLAEEKYQELLHYTASKNKRHIPEKQAVLEYADMETNTIGNYQTADEILRYNILDYYPVDRDALLALGDNSLAWGEFDASRMENAREYYARYMERYGRSDPLLERMLKYFIRTDDLEQILPLQSYFMSSAKREISAATLAELGGYFLDKRFEKISGVPNEYLDNIGGIREILLRAIRQDSMLPESYYQLARYYNYFQNLNDEKLTLDLAVRVFEAAKEENPKRIRYHILTLGRYGEILIRNKEFFPAEENLVKGVNLYQDGLSRRLLNRSPEFGRLYADLGDLEYFVKDGDMTSALDYYRLAEQNGWAPPEIQYRMGAAHYQLRQWGPAQDRLLAAYREIQPNLRILYALGNVSYMRGNYFVAQGYYDRLLEILEANRSRLPPISPTDDERQLDLAERIMVAQNNLGVTLEGLTERTGNNKYRSRAQGLYADSERAWDILTRNPVSMSRMRPSPNINAPGVNPAYLNVQNSLRPISGYEPQFFIRIDKDLLEPSPWEELAPPGYRLSQGLYSGR